MNTGKTTPYKKWAFILLISQVVLQVVIASMIINYATAFDNAEDFNFKIRTVSVIAEIDLWAGIILTILSVVKKENRNYQYYFSLIGYPLILLFNLLSYFA
ncbi:hypothetical protein [Labilibacter marinus]|uniref:hypothetical protein n=1 Tax=Labilibacter marinus TaxID=1477105 RepID=UPI000836396F|nr:hypothetical protein [Labilibacter marinus]